MSKPNNVNSFPQRNAISKATDELVNRSMSVDNEDNISTVTKGDERWEDLIKIVDDLGLFMLEMVNSVDELTSQPDVISLLGEDLGEFNKQRDSFFKDLNAFTAKISKMRATHADKTGPMTSIEDLTTYTGLSMQYFNMTSEIQILLAPSVTSMFLLLQNANDQKTAALESKNGN